MRKLANEINDLIKQSDVYKRYVVSKENIENNEYLKDLLEKMELSKMINCKDRKEEYISEYYELEKLYNNHILVKEYNKNKDDLMVLLQEVGDILTFK